MKLGILALQGAFAAHAAVLRSLGAEPREVRTEDDPAPLPAVFIRAPFVERAGPDVEVLATVDGHAVLCRQGPVTVAAFHPELSHDVRLHDRFLKEI